MKVKDIKTGSVQEVNDCYGARLIEQGKAVEVKEKAAPAEKAQKKTAKQE